MKVFELISINQSITDVTIEIRVEGCALLDALHIGMDYGVKPHFPLMVPINWKHIGNQCMTAKKESKYIRKSINAWDDGKDYWQIKTNRIPKAWLELEVFSWSYGHVFKSHHPRSSGGGSDAYEGIRIVALPAGDEKVFFEESEAPKKQMQIDGQINLF